jgi:hypothetical protein
MKAKKLLLIASASSFSFLSNAQESSLQVGHSGWKMQIVTTQSRRAQGVSPTNTLNEYPCPQLVREKWTNLNGLREYGVNEKDIAKLSAFEGKILASYSLEFSFSGVKESVLLAQNLSYKIIFKKSETKIGDRVMINFGVVDHEVSFFVDGRQSADEELLNRPLEFSVSDGKTLITSYYDNFSDQVDEVWDSVTPFPDYVRNRIRRIYMAVEHKAETV